MCAHPFAKEALTLHLARSEGVVSKNTNELKIGTPGRFGIDVSTLGWPMEARILGHEDADPSLDTRRVKKYKRTLKPTRRAVAEFIYHYHGELNHQGLGNAFVFLDTTRPAHRS